MHMGLRGPRSRVSVCALACAAFALVALSLPGVDEPAPRPSGEPPIFEDAFEASTTAGWSETVDPVYVRWLTPVDSAALPDASPELTLRIWSPPGVAIDSSSLVVVAEGDERDVSCSIASEDPPVGSRVVATCTVAQPFAEGLVTLTASVADVLGRVATPSMVRFTVDTTPPEITVTSPADGLITTAPAVVLEGTVSELVDLRIDGQLVDVEEDLSWSTAPRSLDEGSNVFQLVATDAAGLTALIAHEVVRDTTAPLPIDVGRLTIEEGEPGTLVVAGAAGAAEGGATVRVVRVVSGAPVGETVEVVAAADGSFSVTIEGDLGDVLRIEQLDVVANLSPPVQLAGPWALPPDPATLAPPHDPTIVWDPVESLSFLVEGPSAIQTGVDAGTIEPRRISWLRGRVVDRGGQPLGGAVVRVLDAPEIGQTLTRLDGWFDLVVNGGGEMVVDVTRTGFLGVQRTVDPPWRGITVLDDVVLVALDPVSTTVQLGAAEPQLAESTRRTDDDGSRQATVLVPAGTAATMTLSDTTQPDGSSVALTEVTIRATEFTVGPTGPAAMPGPLPSSVAYTYAVELSVDEAIAAGASRVDFDRPLPVYVDNFLGMPVGEAVPLGWYDREAGRWEAAPNGVVLRIVGATADRLATIDTDGDGVAEPAAELEAVHGIDAAERRVLAGRFAIGAELWRVRVDHFTPWDCNWPYAPPEGASPPPDPGPADPPPSRPGSEGGSDGDDDSTGAEPGEAADSSRDDKDDPCVQGSILECENQVVRLLRPIVGTTHRLAYTSARTPDRVSNRLIRVQITGTEPPPADVTAVHLSIVAQGRRVVSRTYDPAPNLVFELVVGLDDPFGRQLQGVQDVVVRRGFTYPMQYQSSPAEFREAWGRYGTGTLTTDGGPAEGRADATLWREDVYPLDELLRPVVGGLDARAQRMGGWSLEAHHAYEPSSRTLYLGDGTERRAAPGGFSVSLLAGARSGGSLADGVPAEAAKLEDLRDVDFLPDGRMLFTADARLRMVDHDGTVQTLAGSDELCVEGGDGEGEGFAGSGGEDAGGGEGPGDNEGGEPCGIGGPATDARLLKPAGLAVARDGSIVFADRQLGCVLRVTPTGILERVAGVCRPEPIDECPPPCQLQESQLQGGGGDGSGDEIPTPVDVAFGPGETLYIGTESGDGLAYLVPGGGVAVHAGAPRATSLAVDANGLVYGASRGEIFTVDVDGSVEIIAGTGDADEASPDGVPAIGAAVGGVQGLLPLPDGSLLFGERESRSVRRITPRGLLSTVAGSGGFGPLELGVAARRTPFESPRALALSPDRTIAIVEGVSDRVAELRGTLPSWGSEGYEIPSSDGGVVHVFDAQGRHLETRHGITGATLMTFEYDDEGLLETLTDGDGLTTTLERDEAGVVTAIASPYGQRSTLSMSAASSGDGWLETLTNPADEAQSFTYTSGPSGGGLVTSTTDAKGQTKTYEWSAFGRMTRAEDALPVDDGGGFQTFRRSNLSEDGEPNFVVRRETAAGAVTAYRRRAWSTGEELRRTTNADGTRTVRVSLASTAEREHVSPSGMRTFSREAPSPLHGLAGGYPSTITIERPSGVRTVTTSSMDAEYARPGDASSLSSITTSWTVDGRSGSSVYDATTRTKTETSPLGRIRSTTYDPLGRVVRHEPPGTASGAAQPVEAQYSPSGLLEQVRRGTGASQRVQALEYDPLGQLTSVTDPIGRLVLYAHDEARRLTRVTLPDAESVALDWDRASNLSSFTLPGRPSYRFGYTPRNQLATVELPDIGAGPSVFGHVYDADRRLVEQTRPDDRSIGFAYNGRQQLRSIRVDVAGADPEDPPEQLRSFEYDGTTGQLRQICAGVDCTERLSFEYDGSIPTAVRWFGTVDGLLEATVDASFRTTELRLNGEEIGDGVAYSYDDDSMLEQAGALSIGREADTGRVASTTSGLVTTTVEYTPFGEVASQTVTLDGPGGDGSTVFVESNVYDRRGWLTERTVTQAGVSTTEAYGYDLRGRLETVTVDGTLVASYGYDANSNRVAYDGPFGTVTNAEVDIDARDRLLTYGTTSFVYDDAGDLLSRSRGGASETFDYDVFGNLLGAVLADGTAIDYVIDPRQRRIGKRVDGVLVQGFLYQDALNPIAELDASGAIVSRFIYATRLHVPDLMIRDGRTYRFVHDWRGSPRLVLDVDTGAVAQEIRYDEFGRITLDTNPGFQPFGFVGGLHDRHTGLVRLGARDYDPVTGRWTTPDPSGFAGGLNLYLYAGGNPISFVDVNGEEPVTVGAVAWALVELGLTLYDAYVAAKTLADPCATDAEKAAATGGLGLGMILPGGGWGAGGKHLVGAADNLARGADDLVDLSTPARRRHILDGDRTGGGHRSGTGNPGKSEFPASWTDDEIMHRISDVATDPAAATRPGRGGRTISEGTRDGVDLLVVQEADGSIVTGFPTNVPRNPR